jgi:MFS superfamily sulfate permease-like transporter
VKALVEKAGPLPHAVILDAAAQDELDLTGAEALTGLIKDLHARSIAVVVAELHLPVREFSRQTGLLQLIGEENVFYTVEAAVRAIAKTSHEAD